jgi:hypothetical protein
MKVITLCAGLLMGGFLGLTLVSLLIMAKRMGELQAVRVRSQGLQSLRTLR